MGAMKAGDYVRIEPPRDSKLHAIFGVRGYLGDLSGRILRTYPKLGVAVVEFDEDHIFRLRLDEIAP